MMYLYRSLLPPMFYHQEEMALHCDPSDPVSTLSERYGRTELGLSLLPKYRKHTHVPV